MRSYPRFTGGGPFRPPAGTATESNPSAFPLPGVYSGCSHSSPTATAAAASSSTLAPRLAARPRTALRVDRQNRTAPQSRDRTGLDGAGNLRHRCRPKALRPAALCGPRDREAGSRTESNGIAEPPWYHRGRLWLQAARREYR
jgi:hypothetical protein